MKRKIALKGLLVALGLLIPSVGSADILTFYSDLGIFPGFSSIPVYSGCEATTPNAVADGQNKTLGAVPEGYASWQTSDSNTADCYFGWGAEYPSLDLSRFSSGELRFWINSSVPALTLNIKDTGDNKVLTFPINVGTLNQWVEFRIPFSGNLAGTGLSSVKDPFLFTATSAPGTFYIDNVRYVTDDVGAPYFSVALKNRSNGADATDITWSGVTLPSAWALTDQYIQVNMDGNTPNWGIQIYTDNTAAVASPRYTGTVSSTAPTPAGLVDTANTSHALPMAWATRSDVSTITIVAADPNNSSDPNYSQWLTFEDKAQVAVPGLNAAAFANADPFITVDNNEGIHFGQGPTQFGATNSPFRIYLQANFQTAVTPRTYKTSTLTLEFFQQ